MRRVQEGGSLHLPTVIKVSKSEDHAFHGQTGEGVRHEADASWYRHCKKRLSGHHYVEADLNMKEHALARLHEPQTRIQHYRAPASLISFLKAL